MISKPDLDSLALIKPSPTDPFLSVYLDVNQARQTNLNRGFERTLKSMLRSIEQQIESPLSGAFGADAKRVSDFVMGYVPRGQSLSIFCNASLDFFWSRELRVPLRNDARWSEAPYIRPLRGGRSKCSSAMV